MQFVNIAKSLQNNNVIKAHFLGKKCRHFISMRFLGRTVFCTHSNMSRRKKDKQLSRGLAASTASDVLRLVLYASTESSVRSRFLISDESNTYNRGFKNDNEASLYPKTRLVGDSARPRPFMASRGSIFIHAESLRLYLLGRTKLWVYIPKRTLSNDFRQRWIALISCLSSSPTFPNWLRHLGKGCIVRGTNAKRVPYKANGLVYPTLQQVVPLTRSNVILQLLVAACQTLTWHRLYLLALFSLRGLCWKWAE